YAYGCTAFALLGGLVAHAEIGPELEKTLVIEDRLKIYREAIKKNLVPDLFTLTKGRVDKDLSAIVEKCMKSNPDERYSAIAEVLKDLKNRHEGKPVSPLAHIPAYWMGKYAKLYRVTLLVALIALVGLATAYIFAQQRQQSEVANKAFDDILRGREFLDKDDQASAVVFFAESNQVYPTALARGDASLNMPPIPKQVLEQNSTVENAVFSPDGQTLLTAGENSGVKIWSSDGSKQLQSFKTGDSLRAFALSPDGSLVAAGDSSGEVKILNLKNGKILPTVNVGQEITTLAFSPDEKNLLVGSTDGLVHVINTVNTQAQRNFIKTGSGVVKAVFNNDGQRILTLNKEGSARVWDTEGASAQGDPMTISFKDAPNWYIPDIAYSQDGKTILISDWSGSISFYDKDGHHK
ncbi:MAG TPA: protein kinase family protein, partial [bacterium]|nr:protein kinase family protein [bacterium]